MGRGTFRSGSNFKIEESRPALPAHGRRHLVQSSSMPCSRNVDELDTRLMANGYIPLIAGAVRLPKIYNVCFSFK